MIRTPVSYRAIVAPFFFAIAMACTDSHPTAVDGPASKSTPMTQLTVRVDVTGDPEAGPSLYWITLDGFWWTAIERDTNTALTLSKGVHTVALGIRDRNLDKWCKILGDSSYQIRFANDQARSLTFKVNCPPLGGRGVLEVHAQRTGLNNQAGMSARLTRLNEPAVKDSFELSSSNVTEAPMLPGVYSVDVFLRSCGTFTFRVALRTPAVVRDGEKTSLQFSVACPPTICIFGTFCAATEPTRRSTTQAFDRPIPLRP